MDRILYQIFKIILSEYISKKHGENIDKPSVKVYINKEENRITFNTWKNEVTWTENKITKDKNRENVPHLEITEEY